MLNLGMTEIFCFAVIALLVLGPDKLPEAARFTAKWYGKFKRLLTRVQSEIDRELHLSEFREEIQKEIDRMTALEQRVQKQLHLLQQEVQAPAQKTAPGSATFHYVPYTGTTIPFGSEFIRKQIASCAAFAAFSSASIQLKIAV